ncbi:MAG TPA: phosphoribosylaminoimidazolesuccinocarboxamide synthase, partial [Chloroflexota bacterium]|nr:phosphoribosylaminoimidazolesuccinocarboxamide synthase [Chloroflexota bacterium]
PEPIFTPAIKAQSGHDENIPFGRLVQLVGEDLAGRLRRATLDVYATAARYAAQRGIIIADTKMEFGLLPQPDGSETLLLIDELLTPDSSRFWEASTYEVGAAPPSYDKQYVRDYLEGSGWNKEPPAPALPPEVVAQTRQRYVDALRRLTGSDAL